MKRQKDKLRNELDQQVKKNGVFDGFSNKLITPELIDKMFYRLHGKQLMTYITKIEKLIKAPMLYFSDDKTDENLKYNLNTSMNIVNQNGVFTWNASPTKPIEHIPFENSKKNEDGSVLLFSKCININKELANHVKNMITKLGITQEYIYPDAWKIAQQAFEKTK